MKLQGVGRAACRAVLAWGLVCGVCRAAEGLPEASEVTRRLIERAQAVASGGLGPRYRCDKKTTLEELDAKGGVVRSELRFHEVTWVAGFPFNRLVRIQGRLLTPAELQEEERKEQRFQRRVSAADPKKMAAAKVGWVTVQLMERFVFTVKERQMVAGRPTLVLTFQPRAPKEAAKTFQDKIMARMSGTVWVDEAEAEAVKLETALGEPVSLGWLGVLGALDRCELALERRRMPDGVWLNARQMFRIQGRKLAGSIRFRSTEDYTGHAPIPAGTTAPEPGKPAPAGLSGRAGK